MMADDKYSSTIVNFKTERCLKTQRKHLINTSETKQQIYAWNIIDGELILLSFDR